MLSGRRYAWWLLLLALCPLTAGAIDWSTAPPDEPRVALYVFWSVHCPHCAEARRFLSTIEEEPWLRIEQREITQNPANRHLFEELMVATGDRASAVPAFYHCGQGTTGFDAPETTGRTLLLSLRACYERTYGQPPPGLASVGLDASVAAGSAITLPLAGRIDAQALSLPMLTLVMASIDAFNPCAFFVLLFLLSLLTHTRSRGRMLLVGGVFVLVSGLVYFLFMSAWLNLFTLLDHLTWLTTAAGALALALGAINVKDFIWLRRGISLSLTDERRTALGRRTATLIQTRRTPTLLAGTLMLAVAANSYELLCTAGFPMVYTRALTLAALPPSGHYGYLALYNLIYIMPLLTILLIYVRTLGSRRLGEREGRALKLLSGLMMLGLGLALILEPAILSNPIAALALLGLALLVALLAYRLYPDKDGGAPRTARME